MSTISTTKNFGIELGISYPSPLTITSTGYVNADTSGFNGAAVYAAAAQSLALYNYGQIRATGAVQGVHEGSDQGLSITNSGTITAASDAIYLQSSGPIINSGTIISSAGVGIQGQTGLHVTNASTGVISGDAVGIGALSVTINNSGTIRATGEAIYSASGGTVINQGTVQVQASRAGAMGSYGAALISGGYINNSGTFTGDGFAALRIVAGVSLTTSGLISSNRAGVFADFGVIIHNIGTIHGPMNGIFARNGDLTLTNIGTVYGSNAIWVLNGFATITNSGTLEGLDNTAVTLSEGGTLTNQAGGLITAAGTQIGLLTGAAAYTGTALDVVTNAGTITGGTGVVFYAGDTLGQTLIDTGTIIGSGGTAVAFSAGDDLLKLVPGTLAITGTVDGGSGTNTLEFASAASAGVLTGVGADFVHFSQGTIDSGANWTFAGAVSLSSSTTLTDTGTLVDTGTFTNAGTITGTGEFIVDPTTFINTGYLGIQVDLDASALDNTSTGTIKVSGTVVYGAFTGAVFVSNAGTIYGTSGLGIYLAGGGSVSNTGTIKATGNNGVNGIHDAVYSKDGGYVGNTGTTALIYGANHGVQIFGAGGTVSNAGTIQGGSAGGDGVDLEAGGNVTNTGTAALISGTGLYGVEIAGGAGTVSNAGTIENTDTLGIGDGIHLADGGSVANTGTAALIEGPAKAWPLTARRVQ